MKRKISLLLIICMALFSFKSYAQLSESDYINKVMELLAQDNCEGAQSWYDMYKKQFEKTDATVEGLIKICEDSKNKAEVKAPDNPNVKLKTYKIGDKIRVKNETYRVAYVRDGGKHGLAISNKGWGRLNEDRYRYITQRGIPTYDELKLIYQNRDLLRMFDIYWSCTENREMKSSYIHYFYMNFSTGNVESTTDDKKIAIILLIHRF